MGQPAGSEQQQHSSDQGDPAPPAQDAIDGFRLLHGALAVAFVVLLFVPFIGSSRSLMTPLFGNGGELLLPLIQISVVVLQVMATFRPRSVALPKAIALVCAGWLVWFAIDMVVVEYASRLAWGAFVVIVLMAGTVGLATTQTVLGARRPRTDQ